MNIEKKILRFLAQAIADFNMIAADDTLLLCLSGGKDSWSLLRLLRLLQPKSPVTFKILALHVDPGYNDCPEDQLQNYCAQLQVPLFIERSRINEVIAANRYPGSSFCSFCARLRRGVIYQKATALGATKVVLAHHADDLLETLLLNLFYSGQLKSMAPILRTDNQQHIVVRPLIYVQESLVEEYASQQDFPIVDCSCAHQQKDNQQRQNIKAILNNLQKKHPDLKANMLHSLKKVVPSHLLDKRFFDFPK